MTLPQRALVALISIMTGAIAYSVTEVAIDRHPYTNPAS